MEWLIKDISDEFKSWGYYGGEGGKILLKSDGEPAIIALRDAVAAYHGGVVVPERPPVGESQAHGAAEESGKTMRGIVKVYKVQVETQASIKIEAVDCIILWMIRWGAMSYSRFKVGEDGKTAYERQKGRKCRLEVVPCGEIIYCKQLNETAEQRRSLEMTLGRRSMVGTRAREQ